MFKQDLQKGQEVEKRFAKYLESLGHLPILNDNKFYDILWNNLKFEIKTDFIDSPNIAVEFFCMRRFSPSGISVTESDYWVQCYKSEALVLKTSVLKKFIQEHKPPMVRGGDGKNSLLFLIKKNELPVYKRVDLCDK